MVALTVLVLITLYPTTLRMVDSLSLANLESLPRWVLMVSMLRAPTAQVPITLLDTTLVEK